MVLAGALYTCRPEYPTPTPNLAPLAQNAANNTTLSVLNFMVDPSDNPNNDLARLLVTIDGVPATGSGDSIVSTRNAANQTADITDPATELLSRRYPKLSTALTGTRYGTGYVAITRLFTAFTPAVNANIINGVTITPAVPASGHFIPAGRRTIALTKTDGSVVFQGTGQFNGNNATNTVFFYGTVGKTSGNDGMRVQLDNIAVPTPPAGSAAVRFLHLAPDFSEVELRNTATGAVYFNFPNAPSGTVYDNTFATAARRDSLASRRTYGQFTRTIPMRLLLASDPTVVIGNSNITNNPNAFTNRTAATVEFNLYRPGSTEPLLAENVIYTLDATRSYTLVFHGTAATGYKLDLIQQR